MRAPLFLSLAASVLLRTSELSLQSGEGGEGGGSALGSDLTRGLSAAENPVDDLNRKLQGLVDKSKTYFGSDSSSGIDVTPESLTIENTREEELDRKLQGLVDKAQTKFRSGSSSGVDTPKQDVDSVRKVEEPVSSMAGSTDSALLPWRDSAVRFEPYPASADLDMDAYVIAKPALFNHMKDLLVRLGFRPKRVDPVEFKSSSCNGNDAYSRAVHGIFLAHQTAWSKIKESGKSAFVLESDATPGDAPINELKQRLETAATEMKIGKNTPRYIAAGYCGEMCLTAYFMNAKAADIGTQYEFCSQLSKFPAVDYYVTKGICMQAQCTWEPGLPGVHHCADCYGDGLFFQNRTLHGVHGGGTAQRHIKDGETRET